ncbi:hypothetical protein ACTWP5_31085 [Streptomyces sp. 4N509B]|uniref:hypothetical protein n=1 Tax=Streptomyces sp. 4N509B TaxID=3457413 RepID=UPI003FD47173
MTSPLFESKAVLTDGIAYAGIKNLTGEVGREFTWYDLTDTPEGGYPADACSISIAELSHTVRIEVLTTDGEVYETVCIKGVGEDGADVLDCDGVWEPQSVPDPGDPDLVSSSEPLNGPVLPDVVTEQETER